MLLTHDLAAGDELVAKCEAEANPPVSGYAWSVGGNPIDEQSPDLILHNIGRDLNNEALTCIATNTVGETEKSRKLDIQCK